MREIVHIQAGQCGNQIGAKVRILHLFYFFLEGKIQVSYEKMVVGHLRSPSLIKLCPSQVFVTFIYIISSICFWKAGNHFSWQAHFGETSKRALRVSGAGRPRTYVT